MKKFKIGFSSPINHFFPIFSFLIKLIFRIPYSHTYMKFHSDSHNRDIVYESVGVGVRFVGATYWLKHAEIIEEFEIEVTDECYRELMCFCIDQAGTSYGKMQCLGVFLAKIFKMKKNIFKNDKNEEICSEIAGRILSSAGYSFDKDFDLISPKDIYNVLKK